MGQGVQNYYYVGGGSMTDIHDYDDNDGLFASQILNQHCVVYYIGYGIVCRLSKLPSLLFVWDLEECRVIFWLPARAGQLFFIS